MKNLIALALLIPMFSHFGFLQNNAPIEEGKIENPIMFREFYTPSDPYYGSSTISGYTQKSIALNFVGNIETVWNNYKGNGTTIAIIDSGIDINHPDFQGKILNTSGYFHYGYESGYGYHVIRNIGKSYAMHGSGESSHGTNVSGTAAALNNNVGTIGIAPQANILALRVDFQSPSIADAIEYAADQGADVINMSLGMYADAYYDGYEGKWYDQENVDYYPRCDTELASSINYAYNKGCIIIAAAGNECTATHSYPASNAHVIGVGALNYASGTVTAPFSNYNGTSDTQSNNHNVDVVAPGYVIAANYASSTSTYCQTQGTSFSAPIVAGAAALWKEKNPTGTPAQFEEDLYATCDDIGTAGWDRQFGYGRLNIYNLLQYRQAAESITLPEATKNLYVNQTYTLNPTILPAGSYNVTYTSSNTNVATVSSMGVVTAKAAGTAVITARVNNLTATVTINVSDVLITGITLTATTKSLHVNDSFKLVQQITPTNATEKYNVIISNPSMANYSSINGKITAWLEGECDVTVTSASGAVSATCHLIISPAPAEITLTVSPTSVTLPYVGDTKTITVNVTVTPSSEVVEINRYSSDENVATISESNVITATGVGSCDITIEAGDKSATIHVVVLKEKKSSISFAGFCGGNIYISSSVILTALSLGAILLIIRKKKKENN